MPDAARAMTQHVRLLREAGSAQFGLVLFRLRNDVENGGLAGDGGRIVLGLLHRQVRRQGRLDGGRRCVMRSKQKWMFERERRNETTMTRRCEFILFLSAYLMMRVIMGF